MLTYINLGAQKLVEFLEVSLISRNLFFIANLLNGSSICDSVSTCIKSRLLNFF